jgi:peptidoglycan-associated lipoprotein
MMTTLKIAALFMFAGSLVACGGEPKKPPATPAEEPAPQTAKQAPAAGNPKPDDDPTKSQIRISDEIKKACGISDAEARFAFDSANVQPADHEILGKLARCFTDGPLKGRQMRLVGHADPRGEEEYNMVLGGKRADNVKGFLVQKGLPDGQCETSSRGEMDATGTDDASWAQDRRVDVMLAN